MNSEPARRSIAPTALQPSNAMLHVQRLAELGVQRHYRRRALIIQEGEYGDSLYLVQSGRLRVFLVGPNGKELTLGVYGMGDYVGEMSLDGGPRSANVEAIEPSICSVVSKEHLLAYIAQQPEFALVLMNKLIRRARLATESAGALGLIDVYGRLTQLLDHLADPADEQGLRQVREPLTHQLIAQRLACSREMVSRLMKDLQLGGYIAKQGKRLSLLKPFPPRW